MTNPILLRSRGIGYIQLVITLGVSAILISAGFLMIRATRNVLLDSTGEYENSTLRVQLEQKLAKDLGDAVRINGYSRFDSRDPKGPIGFPGIHPLPDRLRLIVFRHPEISIQVRIHTEVIDNQTKAFAEFSSSNPETDKVYQYFRKASARDDYFAVHNTRFNNLVRRLSDPIETEGLIRFEIDATSPRPILMSDFDGFLNELKTIDSIRYNVDPESGVQREIWRDPLSNEIILRQSSQLFELPISQTQFEYRFANGSVGPMTVLGDDRFYSQVSETSCPETLPPVTRCADAEDVRQIRMRFENIAASANVTTRTFSAYNHAYLSAEDLLTSVSFECSPQNPANRCNQDCAHKYKNPNPAAADWIGWSFPAFSKDGNRLPKASDACLCGSNDSDKNYLNPESTEGRDRVANWALGAASNEFVNACIRHYGLGPWGNPYPPVEIHLPSKYARYCSTPVNEFIRANVYRTENIAEDGSNLVLEQGWDGDASVNSLHPLRDLHLPSQSDYRSCYAWSDCDKLAHDTFGITTSAWVDSCKCSVMAKNPDDPTEYLPVHAQRVEWESVCNLETAFNPSSPLTCPKTGALDGSTLVHIQTDPSRSPEQAFEDQTLNQIQRQVCGVLAHITRPVSSGGLGQRNQRLNKQDGHLAHIHNWDWRDAASSLANTSVLIPPNFPINLSLSLANTFGASELISVTYSFKYGASGTRIDMQNEPSKLAYDDLEGFVSNDNYAFGVSAIPFRVSPSLNLVNQLDAHLRSLNPAPSEAFIEQAKKRASYCDFQHYEYRPGLGTPAPGADNIPQSIFGSNSQENEIMRHVITGFTGNVPYFCGNPPPQGGQSI